MVKLKGPSISLGAAGSLGGSLVFATNKGRAYAKKLTKPHQPRTSPQVSQRALTRYLTRLWSSLTPLAMATWLDAAVPPDESPYHTYLRINLDRWSRFEAPSAVYPVTAVLPPCTGLTLTPTARNRTILLHPAFGAAAVNAGYILHRNAVPFVAPAKSNCIAAAQLTSTVTQDLVDGPLAAGAYYYRAVPFSYDALFGAPSAEVSAVIP